MTREEAIQVLKMVEAYGLADEAKRMAIEALSADTVEVVRCKDCKHYKYTEGFKHGRYEAGYGCELGLRRVTADDFCSYGERRAEE